MTYSVRKGGIDVERGFYHGANRLMPRSDSNGL